jgi:hypothetical protein
LHKKIKTLKFTCYRISYSLSLATTKIGQNFRGSAFAGCKPVAIFSALPSSWFQTNINKWRPVLLTVGEPNRSTKEFSVPTALILQCVEGTYRQTDQEYPEISNQLVTATIEANFPSLMSRRSVKSWQCIHSRMAYKLIDWWSLSWYVH